MKAVTHRRSLHVEGHADVRELLGRFGLRLPPSLLVSLRLLLLSARRLLGRLLLKLLRLLLLREFDNNNQLDQTCLDCRLNLPRLFDPIRGWCV